MKRINLHLLASTISASFWFSSLTLNWSHFSHWCCLIEHLILEPLQSKEPSRFQSRMPSRLVMHPVTQDYLTQKESGKEDRCKGRGKQKLYQCLSEMLRKMEWVVYDLELPPHKTYLIDLQPPRGTRIKVSRSLIQELCRLLRKREKQFERVLLKKQNKKMFQQVNRIQYILIYPTRYKYNIKWFVKK